MLEKKKVVNVGNKKFTFVPAGYKEGVYDCEMVCPYNKYCEFLPDPRNPEDKNSTFAHFCENAGTDANKNLVPKNGTIEENYGDDMDVLKILIRKDVLIKTKDFIDNVCPDFCDLYNEEYSNCKASCAGCMLNSLFKNNVRIKLENDAELSTKEYNTTDKGLLKLNEDK